MLFFILFWLLLIEGIFNLGRLLLDILLLIDLIVGVISRTRGSARLAIFKILKLLDKKLEKLENTCIT